MAKRLSQKDLAERAGVSAATVSMALRNHPRISAATRTRIQALAAVMGYHPDPALRALADYRSRTRTRRLPSRMMAVLVDGTEPYPHTRRHQAVFEGITNAASRLGYLVHTIDLTNLDGADRLASHLNDRNIQGAIVMAPWMSQAGLLLEHDRCILVCIGYPTEDLPIDCVTTDDFADVQLAYRRLQELGYERIGLLLHSNTDRHSRGRWSAGFRMLAKDPGAVFWQQHDAPGIAAWIDREDLQAVITRKNPQIGLLAGINLAGRQMGITLAVAKLGLKEAGGDLAGILDDYHALGCRAAEHLDARLRSFDRPPTSAVSLLVPGDWQDGRSAPRRQP